MWSAVPWKDIAPGAQTGRPGGAGPAGADLAVRARRRVLLPNLRVQVTLSRQPMRPCTEGLLGVAFAQRVCVVCATAKGHRAGAQIGRRGGAWPAGGFAWR